MSAISPLMALINRFRMPGPPPQPPNPDPAQVAEPSPELAEYNRAMFLQGLEKTTQQYPQMLPTDPMELEHLRMIFEQARAHTQNETAWDKVVAAERFQIDHPATDWMGPQNPFGPQPPVRNTGAPLIP